MLIQPSRRRFAHAAGALALLGLSGPLLAQTAKRAGGSAKVVLGQSIPMTGAANEIGMAFAAGAKLFVDAHNERAGASGTVLLVDDDALVRATSAELLRELGFQVIEAASGQEARAALSAGPTPRIVITDHLMP
ncbi:MAG: response regulator, partial [Comamonadaceae bacterium]